MGSWNYRFVRIPNEGCEGGYEYGLREVYYDEEGTPTMMSAEDTTLGSECLDDLTDILERVLASHKKLGVFIPPETWMKD